jgi:superfamily I DNA and/or RNA helicase
VCAPSNIAVDTILTRISSILDHLERIGSSKSSATSNIMKLKHSVVRLGHPARISNSIMKYTLDYLISVDEVRNIDYMLLFFILICLIVRELKL